MPAEQTAAELTTRDVLLQVDRRLTLIEEDLRSLDEKVERIDARLDAKIDGVYAKLDGKIDSFYAKLDAKIDGLRHEMYAQFGAQRSELSAKLDSHFKWTIGTLVALASLIAVVFKL